MAVELGRHQLKAIEEIQNGTILKGGVGSGKSRTAIAYFYLKECGGGLRINGKGNYSPMARPRDLYIITTAKKRDSLEWEEEALPFNISTARDASVDGVKLTVDSWNNILNYADYTDAFFIFDEQRLVGSGAWVKAFLKIAKNNRWMILSATPGDNWMDYIPVFIANGFYKNRTEFIRRHVVFKRFAKFPQVDYYVDTDRLYRLRKELLVDMPLERHTRRHIHDVKVEHDAAQMERVIKKRWHIYEDRPIRDIGEMFLVMRKLANSDPSRAEALRELMRKHDRLIVFYNFNFELDILRELSTEMEWSDHKFAEWNGQKHDPVPFGDKWVYFVQYTAGAEAWNCITTDAMVFYSQTYSYRIFEQCQGRIDRMNTPYANLHYYVLKSDTMIDKAISKALGSKKDFNEKEYYRGTYKEKDHFNKWSKE